MMGLGATELIIVLAIALVIFGGKKLRNLGGDLGGAISEFKTSLNEDDEEAESKDKKDTATVSAAKDTQSDNKEGAE